MRKCESSFCDRITPTIYSLFMKHLSTLLHLLHILGSKWGKLMLIITHSNVYICVLWFLMIRSSFTERVDGKKYHLAEQKSRTLPSRFFSPSEQEPRNQKAGLSTYNDFYFYFFCRGTPCSEIKEEETPNRRSELSYSWLMTVVDSKKPFATLVMSTE